MTIRLEALVHGGDALGRSDGQVVFVPFGAPGELVVVQVTEARPDYLRATVLAVREASPDRVTAPCPYFGVCGGCQWQHLAYPAQLAAKTAIVAEQLRRVGGFPDPPVRPIIGMVDPWHYRNHARFTARRRGEVGFTHVNRRWFLPV
ncbi:MAG: TRAM domain-containing protein, partial [Dehalococcoidia bacterium]|nr:TRAM domain-containing protein [Dehalococcoidia bacterium]